MAIIILGDYLHDVILMDWHPEWELFAAYNGTEENVNVTLWAIILMNLGVVEGYLAHMLDTFVFEDYGVAVLEEVDGGTEGGLCLSHESSIAEWQLNASPFCVFYHFFTCVTH